MDLVIFHFSQLVTHTANSSISAIGRGHGATKRVARDNNFEFIRIGGNLTILIAARTATLGLGYPLLMCIRCRSEVGDILIKILHGILPLANQMRCKLIT